MKRPIGIIIIFILLLGAVLFIFQRRGTENSDGTKNKVSQKIEATITHLADGWSRYENKKLGFRFEYPSGKFKFIVEEGEGDFLYRLPGGEQASFPRIGNVVFAEEKDWPGAISLAIYNPPFSTPDEWLEWGKKLSEPFGEVLIEKRIIIAGKETLVTHSLEADGHALPTEYRGRTAVFFDGEIMYVIGTAGLPPEDVERIWKSFEIIQR